MMNFGMEQARERLRHATAACAAAQAGYWEERSSADGEIGETFPKYKQRVLDEKRSLTVEILRRLGLKWVAPSSNGPSSLLVTRPSRERKHPQLPPLAAAGMSFVNNQNQHQPLQEPHNVRREASSEGAWVGVEEVCGPPRHPSPYEAEQQLIVLAAERGRQSAATRTAHGDDGGGITTGTGTDYGGRKSFSNMENEVPDVAVNRIPGGGGCGGGGWSTMQRRDNLVDAERRHPHQHQRSSWRQLKKLNHHHQQHHQRQTSPLLVTPLPAAVVESGGSLPPIADVDSEDWHPYKRARKVSRDEQDRDTARPGTNDNPRGTYLPPNAGSPLAVSGSSSRRASSSSSPSSPSLPPLPPRAGGFYLGPPIVDSSPAGTTTSCSFSPDSDSNRYPFSPPHAEEEREREHRTLSSGEDDADAAAAAVHVLGLRNGHVSAAAATDPAPAVVVVGSKRPREVDGQAPAAAALPASMPSAVNIVRAGGGFAGSTTTMTRHGRGSGGVSRRPSAGPRQRLDRSNGAGAAGPAPKGGQACRDVGCHRRPIYAFKGDTKALCCPIHRSEEMVNVRHPLCRHETCFRQPSFGMEGDQRASFCSEHKLPKMINVSSRRCQASGCLRHPNFGFQGDRRATFCCRHKATGMIDVVSRRCQHPQCVRRPLYAMAGQRAMFCRTHKDPGHTDVVSRRCNFEGGCDRHPSFGWKQADGKARRCAHHRLEGMESVKVNNRRGSTATAAAAALKAKETR